MILDAFFFYAFALLILAGALATVLFRNPVHCALGLIGSLLGVAGVFLLQGAEFLAVSQIIVYVGGIMVLFLFVIMLVSLERAVRERAFLRNWKPVAAFLFACMAAVAFGVRDVRVAPTLGLELAGGNTEMLGTALLTGYLLPFEIASVLLLAAVVGSIVMAKKRI